MKSGRRTIRPARGSARKKGRDLCDFCGGELEAEVVDLDLRAAGELLVCEGLPAEVCKQCRENYFSATVSEKIDRFLETYHREKPSRYLPTPVYSKRQIL